MQTPNPTQPNPTQPTYTTTGAYPAPDAMTIMSPNMQYGFAAFAFALLLLVAWLIRELVGMVKSKDVLEVVRDNTKAFQELKAVIEKMADRIDDEGRR